MKKEIPKKTKRIDFVEHHVSNRVTKISKDVDLDFPW
jgi:hypothetical protein